MRCGFYPCFLFPNLVEIWILYNVCVSIPSARLYCKYKMEQDGCTFLITKPQEFSVLKIQFSFDISNINISNTINISKWAWVENHSFFVYLYHRYLYLKFLSVSNTFLSSNKFYIMGFRCIPAIPVSLNSQQQSFNIYIYSG